MNLTNVQFVHKFLSTAGEWNTGWNKTTVTHLCMSMKGFFENVNNDIIDFTLATHACVQVSGLL